MSTQDAQDNKLMGILAYLGILVLVPIFAAKDSPFAKFHANQGLILAIVEIAYGIVYSILTFLFSLIFMAVPVIALILLVILCIPYLVLAIFAIMGIVSAVKGEMKPLPIIGKFVILK